MVPLDKNNAEYDAYRGKLVEPIKCENCVDVFVMKERFTISVEQVAIRLTLFIVIFNFFFLSGYYILHRDITCNLLEFRQKWNKNQRGQYSFSATFLWRKISEYVYSLLACIFGLLVAETLCSTMKVVLKTAIYMTEYTAS